MRHIVTAVTGAILRSVFGNDGFRPTLEVNSIATDHEHRFDSLVFVDLLARLEETVGVEIDLADLDIDQFRSVEKIAHYLDACLGTVLVEVVA